MSNTSKFIASLLVILLVSKFETINTKKELTSDEIDYKDWMSRLPYETKIVLLNLPGTHDSAAFKTMNSGADILAQCQKLNITEQLELGIRTLDIRAAIDKDMNLICVHGICDLYYEDEDKNLRILYYKQVVLEVKQFLEQHPTETIFFSTNSGRGDSYNNTKMFTEIFEEIIPEDMRVKYNRYLILGDIRGKIVHDFYKTDKYDEEGRPIYHRGIDGGSGIEEIHRKYADYECYKVDGELKVKELQDLFSIYDKISFEDAEKMFSEDSEKFPLNYDISCTGEAKNFLPRPKLMSETVNPFVLNYDLKNKHYYGWIRMDFAEIELVKKIIETNF